MKLRRYAVTVMDNWTPVERFWTLKGAVRWKHRHPSSHIFRWGGNGWCEIDDDGEHLWTDAYTVPFVSEKPWEPEYDVMYCRYCGASKPASSGPAGNRGQVGWMGGEWDR